jgi:hypothetical protein
MAPWDAKYYILPTQKDWEDRKDDMVLRLQLVRHFLDGFEPLRHLKLERRRTVSPTQLRSDIKTGDLVLLYLQPI